MNFTRLIRAKSLLNRFQVSKYCTKIIPITPKTSQVKIEGYVDPQSGVCIPEVPPECIPCVPERECVDDTGDSGPPPPKVPLVRVEKGEVFWAFVPIEWYCAFVPKTGATGFFTFLFTVSTYLISKEILVMEHNFYNGLSVAIMWGLGIKYVGPVISQALDKEVDAYEKAWKKKGVLDTQRLEDFILDEQIVQFQADGQNILMKARRENVVLQLEANFRERQMIVYEEVLKRLDYQVDVGMVYRKIQQKNLIEYVKREVLAALSPEMHSQIVWKSLEDLIKDIDKQKESGTVES